MRNTVRKRGFIKSLLPSFGSSDAPLFHRSVRGIDPTLLILVLLLAAAGTVTIFSAGFAYAENRYHNGYYFIADAYPPYCRQSAIFLAYKTK